MVSKALAKMTSDVNVGINEVVSVFVTQYEDSLFAKKNELSAGIKQAKGDIKTLDQELKNSVDRSVYDINVPVLNLTSKVDSVSIVWKGEEDEDDYESRKYKRSLILIHIEVKDNDNKSRYSDSLNKSVEVKISKADEKHHTQLLVDQRELSAELVEVLNLIKSVSRKERQVRGRISAMKLAESGYTELLKDESILALIQLD